MMRWLKHISSANGDEVLSELMDQFGAEGYGVWWIVLEKIACLMDETDRCFARYSVKVWANSCRISPKKFQNVINFLEKKGKFFSKNEDGFLTIECPNLLKYRDEYSKKKNKPSPENPDKLRTNSGQTPEQDTDTDTDTDTDKLSSLCSDNLNTDSLRSSVVEKNKNLPEKIPSDDVNQVFEHWKTVMNHPSAKLDEKRKKFIKSALKMGYTAEKLCMAIHGCSKTPHNIGMNEQGQRYDGLHIIMRNADQIDRFIHNSHDPPKIKTKGDFALQANIQAGQNWLDKKMQQAQAENARTYENEK